MQNQQIDSETLSRERIAQALGFPELAGDPLPGEVAPCGCRYPVTISGEICADDGPDHELGCREGIRVRGERTATMEGTPR